MMHKFTENLSKIDSATQKPPNSAKTVILAKKISRNGTLLKQINSPTLLLKINV